MTNTEAIQTIRDSLGFCKTIEPYSDEMEAFGMAIEALEKQIPKKPVLKKHTNRVPDEQNVYYCPCCVEWSSDTISFAFCPDCGQALDWSDFLNE